MALQCTHLRAMILSSDVAELMARIAAVDLYWLIQPERYRMKMLNGVNTYISKGSNFCVHFLWRFFFLLNHRVRFHGKFRILKSMRVNGRLLFLSGLVEIPKPSFGLKNPLEFRHTV